MNKPLESLHVGKVIAVTDSTHLFEALLHGKIKNKVRSFAAF